MNEGNSFWNSILGKFIRWMIYIPFGMILSHLVLALLTMSSLWSLYNIRGTIILLIILGGVPLGFYLYAIIQINYMAVDYIVSLCPYPKIGNILFGIVYYPFYIYYCLHMFYVGGRHGDQAGAVIVVLHAIVAMLITGYVLVKTYMEAKNE